MAPNGVAQKRSYSPPPDPPAAPAAPPAGRRVNVNLNRHFNPMLSEIQLQFIRGNEMHVEIFSPAEAAGLLQVVSQLLAQLQGPPVP